MRIPQQMYVDGSWADAEDGASFEVLNPATEEVVGHVPQATSADIEQALDSAQRGYQHWRNVDAWTRSATLRRMAEWLRSHAAMIAAVITEEQGKPESQATAEVGAAVDQFDWYADEARRIYGRVVDGHSTDNRILVRRQPVGPVAAFTPSNFPVLLPARKIAPALASGCSIVLKPAESTPRAALMLGLAAAEVGLPAGVLNIVTGDPEQVSTQLV